MRSHTERYSAAAGAPAAPAHDYEYEAPAPAPAPGFAAPAPPERYAQLRVVARVRPPAAAAPPGAALCLQQLGAASLRATLVEKNKLVRGAARGEAPRTTTFLSARGFSFDAVFAPRAATAELFEAEVAPLCALAARGASCCVLAYGATGSGKTHTLTGSPHQAGGEGAFGLLHMVAVELCGAAGAAAGDGLGIYVTGGEVYQEELLDLGAAAGNAKPKRLSTTTLRRVPIQSGSPGELVDAVERFVARRAAGATNKNETSSRSHAVFTIALERRGAPAGALALVDLAGAEYAAATEGRDDTRRLEGGKNNLGLMTLKAAFRHIGGVAARAAAGVGAAAEPPLSPPPPPFSWHRSKLTAALRPFFTDASGRMLMLITASPDAVDAAQTSQTLEEGVLVAGRVLEEKVVTEAVPVAAGGPAGAGAAPENGGGKASFLRAGAGGAGVMRGGGGSGSGGGGAGGVKQAAGAPTARAARPGGTMPLGSLGAGGGRY